MSSQSNIPEPPAAFQSQAPEGQGRPQAQLQPATKPKKKMGIGAVIGIIMAVVAGLCIIGMLVSAVPTMLQSTSSSSSQGLSASADVSSSHKSSTNGFGIGWDPESMISSTAGSAGSSANSSRSTDSVAEADTSSSYAEDSEEASGEGWVSGDQKIVYTASLELETTDYKDSYDKLRSMISEYNAVLSAENAAVSKSTGKSSVSLTVLVPADKYDSFMDNIGDVATITGKHAEADNITKQYSDTKSEIESYEVQEKRLLELEAQASSVDEILDIETRLQSVRSSLSSKRNSLASMDTAVAYSTVDIRLSDVSTTGSSLGAEEDFGTRMGSAAGEGFDNFVKGGQDFLVWCAHNWPGLIITVIIIVLVIALARRASKKSKERAANAGYWTQAPMVAPVDNAAPEQEFATADLENSESHE